jgi:hypothetical protein
VVVDTVASGCGHPCSASLPIVTSSIVGRACTVEESSWSVNPDMPMSQQQVDQFTRTHAPTDVQHTLAWLPSSG